MDVIGRVILALAALAALVGLLSLIPALPAEAVDALAQLVALARGLDGFLPIDLIWSLFALVLSIEATIMLIRALRWLWKRMAGGDD